LPQAAELLRASPPGVQIVGAGAKSVGKEIEHSRLVEAVAPE
jgi:hypothetical protein